MLGKITAGNPIEAIELIDEHFPIPSFMVPKNKEIFALNVCGYSMVNKGISDGDVAIIER